MTNQDTKEMLSRYNNALTNALHRGLDYTKLLTQLIDSDDKQLLLTSAKELATYHLDNAYLKYPKQYVPEDYYLLFMNRLFEQHDEGNLVSVAHSVSSDGLSQHLTALKDQLTFKFKINSNANGGAFYYASGHDQPIFYINLDTKVLKFNSNELTKLFLIHLFQKVDLQSLQGAINTFRRFGKLIIDDYHFKVDFGILETHNNHFYEFVNPNLSKDILDKLFIAASIKNYMLKAYQVHGAELSLDDSTIHIYDHPDSKHWGLEVIDEKQRYSWLELMISHDFLRQWYLNNLKSLEMNTNDLIFS